MPQIPGERQMARSKELRKAGKEATNPDVKRQFNDAADRLEKQAGKAVGRIGRKPKRKDGGLIGER